MKQILVMMAAMVLVGCGKKEPDLRSEKVITPDEAANKLFVEAVQLIASGDEQTGEAAIKDYEQGLANIQTIIDDYSESDLAVKLISGETLFTGKSLKEIQERVKELKRDTAAKRVAAESAVVTSTERSIEDRFLAGELTEADLAKVMALTFYPTQITDEGLKEVAKLPQLKVLFLNGTKITDAGLKELTNMQKLTHLSLEDTQITDAGLKDVAKLQKLKALVLNDTKITDAGLKELAELQKLTDLYLRDTKVTKAGVAELNNALPNCFISGL